MRRRVVTGDEGDLWRRAVRDVRPKRGAPQPIAGGASAAATPACERTICEKRHLARAARAIGDHGHFIFGGGDPARDRVAGGRRLPIERTLDLHGMTQVEAHVALLRFVSRSAADGLRLVLVITGKGRASGRMGVLRERFLDWIEAPPLRGEIARVSPARSKDGGAGAFYVHLKSKGAGRAATL